MKHIGTKPTGLQGLLAGRLMNIIHAGQYRKIINKHFPGRADSSAKLSILDIGCGGGKVLSIFSSRHKHAKACGIDHSPEMVALSGKVNRKGIASGAVEIIQGSAEKLPFPDGSFNAVTAFDNISFWNDHESAISEIRRVLKQGGFFLIVNGYPAPGTKWYEVVKFKSDEEYRAFLNTNGFKNIHIGFENHTIIIKAIK